MLDAKTLDCSTLVRRDECVLTGGAPSPALADVARICGATTVHQSMPISRVMSRNVVTFSPDTSVEHATETLLTRGISGAPVVDGTGRPLGIVSKTDLLESWHNRVQQQAQGALDADAGGVRVGDIMVPYLLAISQRGPISLAAALMAYEGVSRLVVLGDNGKMVGIVTALDIVRWVAKFRDAALPRTTRLRQVLG